MIRALPLALRRFACILISLSMAMLMLPLAAVPAHATTTYAASFRVASGTSYVQANSINMGTVDISNLSSNTVSKGFRLYNTGSGTIKTSTTYALESGWSPFSFEEDASGRFMATNGYLYDRDFSLSAGTYALNYQVEFNLDGATAGTYTAKMAFCIEPASTMVNGGSIASSMLRYTNGSNTFNCRKVTVPVSITLTGTNPNLPGPVQNLQATAENGQVHLSWDAPSRYDDSDYCIYRREGAETASSINAVNSDDYEYVDTVSASRFSSSYVDTGVVNEKTYTYVVMCELDNYRGGLQGYFAWTSAVTPSASIPLRPAPPAYVYASGVTGKKAIEVSWKLDVYGETAGKGSVEHFNVYMDGKLVAQVKQSAVDSTYGEYEWRCEVDVPKAFQEYSFAVTAVNREGVEGYASKPTSAYSYSQDDIDVSFHWYSVEYGQDDDDSWGVMIRVETNPTYDLNVYRDDQFVGVLSHKGSYGESFFFDKDVSLGQTYTYALHPVDTYDREGDDFLSLAVKTPTRRTSVDLTPSLSLEGSVNDGTVELKLSNAFKGITYSVYRNGTKVASFGGNDGTLYYRDTPKNDGTYEYKVVARSNGCTCSESFTYVKDSHATVLGEVPAAVRANAYIIKSDKYNNGNAVVVSWFADYAEGDVEGFRVYRICNNPEYDRYFGNGRDGDSYEQLDASTFRFTDSPEFSKTSDGQLLSYTYYVCAYNKWGASTPSESFVFSTVDNGADGDVPSQATTSKPSAPKLTARVVKEDPKNNDLDTVRVAIEPGKADDVVDEYEVTAVNPEGGTYEETLCGSENEWKIGTNWYFGQWTISVKAINALGSSATTTVTVVNEEVPRLTVRALGSTKASLSWTEPEGVAITGYAVYRKSPYGSFTKVADLAARVTGYKDSGLTNGWSYDYYVVANGTLRSLTKSITLDGRNAEAAPLNLACSVSDTEGALLTWSTPEEPGASLYYRVYWREAGTDGSWDSQSSNGIPALAIKDVAFAGKTLEFKVEYDGVDSNVVTAMMPDDSRFTSGKPQPWYVSASSNDKAITLSVREVSVSDDYPAANLLIIWKSWTDAEGYTQRKCYSVPRNGSETPIVWQDEDVLPGVRYTYQVASANGSGTYGISSSLAYGYQTANVTFKSGANDPAVVSVTELINALPATDQLTPADADRVSEAKAAYDALNVTQRPCVASEVKSKLDTAVDKVSSFSPSAADRAKAQKASELIAAIGDISGLELSDAEKVAAIDAASNAFKKLSSAGKALVSDADKAALNAAVTALSTLRSSAALEEALAVFPATGGAVDLDNLDIADRDSIQAAEDAIDAAKDVRDNLLAAGDAEGAAALDDMINAAQDAVDAAKDRIDELVDEADRVQGEIDALPAPGDVTLADKDAIGEVEDDYNALTDGQKGLVDETALLDAVSVLATLENDTFRLTFVTSVYCKGSAIANEPIVYSVKTGRRLVAGTDYSLTGTPKASAPGSYRVTVVGKGKYAGKALSFTWKISVKAAALSKVSRGKGTLTVKVKKLSSTYASGYQIRYSTKKSMKKAKVVKCKLKAVKTKLKLKSKKTYYVQVRAYKKVGGKTYYSIWSKAKKYKTK